MQLAVLREAAGRPAEGMTHRSHMGKNSNIERPISYHYGNYEIRMPKVPSARLLNARWALIGVGSSANEETPWSPPGVVASNVGSRRSSRPMSPAIRA